MLQTTKMKWSNEFIAILQNFNSDYKLNKNAKGKFTECLRECGPYFYSQSTVFLNGQYCHCFSVSFTDQISEYLNSPFWAGARFNQNHTIFHAFERDLDAVVRGPDRMPGIHSTHSRRAGTEAIVQKCTENAEIYLAPHYISELKKSFPLLLRILKVLTADPDIVLDEGFCSIYAHPQFEGVDLNWKLLMNPSNDWAQFGADLPKVLIASCREKFLPHMNQFDKIYERVQQAANIK